MLKVCPASLLLLLMVSANGMSADDGLSVVSKHRIEFDAPARQIPSGGPTDAPLLGNGDFLAALGGAQHSLQYYLGKADLWELRPDGGPRALGVMDLSLPALEGASYHVEQDLARAVTIGTFRKGNATLTMESAVAGGENLMWIQLSATGAEFAGNARLRSGAEASCPPTVVDNDQSATIGRENLGNGRYHFQGEIADVSINADSSFRSPATTPVKPEAFDEKSGHHEMPVSSMKQSVGVSAWIKIARADDANYIVSKGEWNKAYSLGLSSGRLRWSINGSFLQSEEPLPLGKWIHVAGSFNGKEMKMFLDGKLIASTNAKWQENTQVIERSYAKGGAIQHATGAAAALRVVGGKEGAFTVSPGKPVLLVIAASGLGNVTDYRGDAVRRVQSLTSPSLVKIQKAHAIWWKDFWGKSYVEIPDKKLEKHYYTAHYAMASASRLPHFPPGLYGWTTGSGTPTWGGALFNNYNFFAPFYGLYAANHIEQAMPCNDAVIDALELGRQWAEDEGKYERLCGNALRLKNAPGILLPVSMLPYGVTGAPTTWGQRTNASYACVPLASTWYATYDHAFAKRAYPFVREVATFWEHFLVWEKDRYVDRNDAALENSGRDTNPALALALIRQVMGLALDMSQALGEDMVRREKWTHIRDHLSDFPVCTVNDLPQGSAIAVPRTPENLRLPIFRYSEQGTAWQNDNAVGIQHIFPGNSIGKGSRPELLERSRNMILVMGRWIDLNGTNSFYPAAARVGYDPVEILKKLRHWSDTTWANGMRADNPHGMEHFSVVPSTIQEMLLQSYDGTLRFFPNWPRDLDARFGTLRARGAFLVSADLKNSAISGVKILSEKGRECWIQNPWPNQSVNISRNGKISETVSGDHFSLKTQVGETLELSRK